MEQKNLITTKILTRNLITGFLFFVIVSSISLSVLQSTNSANEQRMTNDENDFYHVNSLTNETSLTTSKPLPGKEYVEYYQADFLTVQGNDFLDVTIVLPIHSCCY